MLELEILDLLKRLPYQPTRTALKDMLIKNEGCSNADYDIAIFKLLEKNKICVSQGGVQFVSLPEAKMQEIENEIIEQIKSNCGSIREDDLYRALGKLHFTDQYIGQTLASLQDHIIYKSEDYYYLTDTTPSEPPMEAISRETLAERERCIQIVWDNRGKCASNQAALALMNEINGNV